MVQKRVKKALKQKKKDRAEELRAFDKISVSNSDQESIDSNSSEEGQIWKFGSGELSDLNINHGINHGSKKLKQYTESFLNLDNHINDNYNHESLRSCLVSHSLYYENKKNSKSSMQKTKF